LKIKKKKIEKKKRGFIITIVLVKFSLLYLVSKHTFEIENKQKKKKVIEKKKFHI